MTSAPLFVEATVAGGSASGTGLSSAESVLLRSAAAVVRPRRRERPSAWAASNIVLTSKQSSRTGPFDPDYLPWTRAVLDVEFDHPGKLGCISKKPSQVGWSVNEVIKMLWACANDPGPMLYITDKAEKAATYANTWFWTWVKSNPKLGELFAGDDDPTHRELMFHKEFAGGVVDFLSAQTESSVTSEARRRVYLDEYQLSAEAFPRASGDLFETAMARMERYRGTSWIEVFGHPRFAGEDIDELYQRLSDCRSWTWDCPHEGCGGPIVPDWSMVHFAGLEAASEDPVLDPVTAELRCPHCLRTITDGQRMRAVWAPAKGGTGRFESTLDAATAASRRFVGLSVHRLSDPLASVRSLAERFVSATTEEKQQSFRNKGLGEVVTRSKGLVTIESVQARIATADTIILPGGPMGVQLLTAGIDVQAPEHNPTLVTSVMAWAPTGHAWIVGMEMLSGWAALMHYLRSFAVRRAGVDGSANAGDTMGVMLAALDCAAWTGQVLDNCRLAVYSAATNAMIGLLPVRYQTHVKSTSPAVMPNEAKRIDPTRPHLGLQERYDLHRNTWVGRGMRRWIDGRVTVLCPAPKNLLSHVTANTQTPLRDKFGYETGEMEWARIKNRTDDWLQACVYAEVGAAVKLGLDRLHEIAASLVQGPPATEESSRRSWIGSARRGSGSFFGR
ncbi:MAG: terminase gpA endonuclease subunit [Phycisphaerales bacterium]